jgi:hypothetical protein
MYKIIWGLGKEGRRRVGGGGEGGMREGWDEGRVEEGMREGGD